MACCTLKEHRSLETKVHRHVGNGHQGVEPLCPFPTLHTVGNDCQGAEPLYPFTTLSYAWLGYVCTAEYCPNAQNALIAGKLTVSRCFSATDFLALMDKETSNLKPKKAVSKNRQKPLL